jgi:single-stranded-DNA-specific exonuclease
MLWQILSEKKGDLLDLLLENRGLKTRKQKGEFLKPLTPEKLSLKEVGLSTPAVAKAVSRIKKAVKNKEKIVVYGDYDTDGVCATAILWEALHKLKADAWPYIPERVAEGYGLNVKSILKLKSQIPNLKLIITVDNGIVAHKAVKKANELGIEVIITDHHEKEKKLPPALTIVHTQEIGGAAVAWFLARELGFADGLELAAIGTIADLMPLQGANRSLVKYGLQALGQTTRPGLNALFEEARVAKDSTSWQIGTYEVGYLIAPRINAMGRLKNAMDSLRLLCTTQSARASQLAEELGRTNQERQRIVEEVLLHVREQGELLSRQNVIVVAHESYHEGVIGLAAAGLVEKFWRPAVVFAKGEKYAKASARSIPGFNLIAAVRELSEFWVSGGGHPMAAGFTIKTEHLLQFSQKLNEIAAPLLTPEILTKKVKIDTEVEFGQLNEKLAKELLLFEPTGIGNPTPVFASFKVEILDAKTVGKEDKHLKLYLRQGGQDFSAIAFGLGYLYPKLSKDKPIDIAYSLEENTWNGETSLQLKIKDIVL